MGISFNPGGASWSYTGYGQFRRQIAKFEGIDDLERYWGNPLREEEQPTVLYPLLDANDVHGFISGYRCAMMLPRMKAIMEFLGDRLDQYDRGNMAALIVGMEHCAEHKCALSYG